MKSPPGNCKLERAVRRADEETRQYRHLVGAGVERHHQVVVAALRLDLERPFRRMTRGRSLRLCGAIGLRTMALLAGWTMGPPQLRE